MPDDYRNREIQRVADAGPITPDETWFRLVISGNERTRHLNVSTNEVDRIAATLGDERDDRWFSVNLRCEDGNLGESDENERNSAIASVLRRIADSVEMNSWGPVRDINGNRVGTYRYHDGDGWEPRG